MKTFKITTAFAALALLSVGALAKDAPCTPVTGNWNNAAKFNCHGHLGGGGTGSDGSSEKDCGDRETKKRS